VIEQARGYAIDRVNRAKGDAVLFEEVYAAYRRAPEVTRRRIFLETMEAVYPSMERKILLDNGLEGVLPLMQLGGAEVKP
jgi:membrane protease subunit HflK